MKKFGLNKKQKMAQLFALLIISNFVYLSIDISSGMSILNLIPSVVWVFCFVKLFIDIVKNKSMYFNSDGEVLRYFENNILKHEWNIKDVKFDYINKKYIFNKYILRIIDDIEAIEIDCSHLEAKALLEHLKVSKDSLVVEEIRVLDFDKNIIPLIKVLGKNQTHLIFEEFPTDSDKFSEKQLNNLNIILNEISNVSVTRDDRELFIINSNDREVIKKIVNFLNMGYTNIIYLTKILTNNDEIAVREMTKLVKQNDLYIEENSYWCEDIKKSVLLIFAYALAGYDTDYKFGAFIDWKEEADEVLESLKLIIKNLGYSINLDEFNFSYDESTAELLKNINAFFEQKGYKLVFLDTNGDCYHLFITPLEKYDEVVELGNEIGFVFCDTYL